MRTIGHRGAAGLEPENTLRSFQRAIALGCDMVELDVHVCKTGEVVVIHDATVDRTTNGHGRVADLTLTELKKLDAGKGEHIPTLEEVLVLCNGKVDVMIEVKVRAAVTPIANLISLLESQARVDSEHILIVSMHQLYLRNYRKLRPNDHIGVSFWWLGGWWRRVQQVDAKAICAFFPLVTQAMLQSAQKLGIQVFAWTPNASARIQKLRAKGVDGIITNFPDRVT